jgi:hypothetical protein
MGAKFYSLNQDFRPIQLEGIIRYQKTNPVICINPVDKMSSGPVFNISLKSVYSLKIELINLNIEKCLHISVCRQSNIGLGESEIGLGESKIGLGESEIGLGGSEISRTIFPIRHWPYYFSNQTLA